MKMIECTNLSKQFGSKYALRDINFELEQGAPIALVGPNGAGKTTLFSLLCGYIQPSQGDIKIFGHPPGHSSLFGQVAALPQDAQLDPRFSISKQLCHYGQLQGYSKKEALSEAQRVLALVELSDVINAKPGALSHGMRKRVAIAQALIGKPDLIMLDEPTAGLDPRNARNIRQMVAKLSSEATFIISSHNLNELERLSQTVLCLELGEISEHSAISAKSDSGYLTIQMDVPENIDPSLVFKQLASVIDVQHPQKYEYVIQYDNNHGVEFDQQLLSCLAEHGWNYYQLIKGKTLEEQLFSNG